MSVNCQSPDAQPFTLAGDELPVLDLDVFMYLRETLTPVVLAQIYREFLERTRIRLETLSSADHAGIHEFTHTVIGTAGMIGAQGFALTAASLRSVEAGSAELAHNTQRLVDACNVLEDALRREQVQL